MTLSRQAEVPKLDQYVAAVPGLDENIARFDISMNDWWVVPLEV